MDTKKSEWVTIRKMAAAAVIILTVIYFKDILAVLSKIWNVFFPLVLGAIMAFVLNIPLTRLEKLYFPKSKNRFINKSRRIVCIFLSLILIVLILALVILLVVPKLTETITIIGNQIPVWFEMIKSFAMEHEESFPTIAEQIENMSIDWDAVAKKLISYATSGLGSLMNATVSVVGSIAGTMVNFFMALIFSIYILADKERISEKINAMLSSYMKTEKLVSLRMVTKTANKTFTDFIIGQCKEAVILGSLCILGMAVFRFPYATTVGTFIGVTALLPIIGAYLGAIVGVLMIITVDPIKAILFVVFIVVLQQTEGNLIYPKVVGSSIGLPGILVFSAVMIGGGIGGIFGMLLGVPLTATLYKLLNMDMDRRKRIKGNK